MTGWNLIEAHTSIITNADMQRYATERKEKYAVMYQSLQKLKKEFPSTVNEYSTHSPQVLPPVTCNPGCTNIGFETGDLSGWNAYDAADNSTACCMSYTA